MSPAERKQWKATMKAQAKIDATVGIVTSKQPRPAKFPMKFKEFLRRMFGGRYHADRLYLFRKYLRWRLEPEYVADCIVSPGGVDRIATTEKRADDRLAELNRNGVTDPEWYSQAASSIKTWRKINQTEKRRNAAKSRWAKEKSKKPIAGRRKAKITVSHGKGAVSHNKVAGSYSKM